MWFSVIACLGVVIVGVGGQPPPVPPLGNEFDDKGTDGSYKFGFQTGDRGNHYRTEIASKDNQVAGRFGARDPMKNRVVETQYTAGRRGFRAKGPNIARQMDLSQNKIPYNPPVSPDSPNYNPTYKGYHDPNEDPSYKFGFRTPHHSKQEVSDSLGHVEGVYSFVDDVGERHDVRYKAGSGTGFNVETAFPDSKPFTGLFYKGAPGKAGGKPRGRSTIQQRLDGSYQFIASAPDHRRTETSDRNGNVRGSYTFIDDKGQQRTIEYIAGPKIGYKVIKKGVGPSFPPGPSFLQPTSFFAPFSPNFEGVDSGDFPPGGGSGRPKPSGSTGASSTDLFVGSPPGNAFVGAGSSSDSSFGGGSGDLSGSSFGGSGSPSTTFGGSGSPSTSFGGSGSPSTSFGSPSFGGSTTTRPLSPSTGGSFIGESGPSSETPFSRPPGPTSAGGSGSGSFGKPGGGGGASSFPTGIDSGDGFRPGSDYGSISGTSSTSPSTISGSTGFGNNDIFGDSSPIPPFDPFSPSTTYRPPTTSNRYPGSSSDIFPTNEGKPPGSNKEPSFPGYPNDRPSSGASLVPGDLPNNCCRPRPSSTSISLSSTSRTPPNYDDIYLQSPSFNNDSPPEPPPFRPTVTPPPDYPSRPPYSEYSLTYEDSNSGRTTFRESYQKDDDEYTNSDKTYFRVPGPVRAHVQSIDLTPYGSRIPSPGEALERGLSHD